MCTLSSLSSIVLLLTQLIYFKQKILIITDPSLEGNTGNHLGNPIGILLHRKKQKKIITLYDFIKQYILVKNT